MDGPANASWRDTTHDWAVGLDVGHLEQIRRRPAVFAPGGVMHLVLEVLAYAADEAACAGSGRAVVIVHPDGSVSITDDGRGTDTRVGNGGQMVKKPVMGAKDLRFFDFPEATVLPDGHPRRGMSVVAALSEWLVHVNRRRDGAWTQRYEHGIPLTDLMPAPKDAVTGTTVHFLADQALVGDTRVSGRDLREFAVAFGPHLSVEVLHKPR